MTSSTNQNKGDPRIPVISAEVSGLIPGDFAQINRIMVEHGLSPYKREEFIKELSRSDNLAFCLRIDGFVVSFTFVRLITIKSGADIPHSNNLYISKKLPTVSEAEIHQITTDKESLRRGYGQSLFSNVLRLLRSMNCKNIWLEVRRSNKAAQTFYFRNGFEVISVRKDYYTTPREDALVCLLKLETET